MTYIVFGGTLSLTQSINHHLASSDHISQLTDRILQLAVKCAISWPRRLCGVDDDISVNADIDGEFPANE